MAIKKPARPAERRVIISSFGFKYGKEPDADLRADVRFLPNPYYIEGLRRKSGKNPAVQKYLLDKSTVLSVIEHLVSRAKQKLFGAKKSSSKPLAFAIGCTGGRHRSVVVAECVAKKLRECGCSVTLRHRDINRK